MSMCGANQYEYMLGHSMWICLEPLIWCKHGALTVIMCCELTLSSSKACNCESIWSL